jgi:acyl transferase domain-containing protein/3-hydroxymyristoyl/3-hydroxydecanoyl-(acyl carrier protein) dehydratase
MENIAVVGIANLFPGAKTPEEFWQNLLDKKDCRSKVSDEQMGVDSEKYFGKKGDTDKYYCLHGGYVSDFHFDAKDYLLDENYLKQLDDLFQWTLYVAQQALKDAGYWQSPKLQQCGAILGNLSFPTKYSNHLFLPMYHQVVDDALKQLTGANIQLSHFSDAKKVHPDNALIAGYPSALLAQAVGLGGSHFSLDAACASSCYSVKLACDYLHTGKADMMLAGAVSAADPMFVNMGFSIFQAYPANNISAPLDANSQGLFAGEGAGMMLLKRHSDAVRDGDKILAIIKGGALSNDGKGEFVLSPNTKGQVLAYERAYADAEVNPADIAYVECHATGTPKGDKVELTSMETFFSRCNNKPLLGSVKSNLGHLLTAAGMPGMTKAIWALNTGKLPGTLHLKQALKSKTGYFSGEQIPTDTIDWPSATRPKQAGVSVFGFGGSNAHLVLQEPSQQLEIPKKQAKPREKMAIVGMDAHFGGAKDLAAFDQLIQSNGSTLRELPAKRWKGMEKNATLMQAVNLVAAPKAGYIDHFDIDFLRFKIPPNEKDCLIPQQLMMMKVADNAALDAGLKEGANVAVLVAMGIEQELHQYRGRVNLTTQIEQTLKEQGIQLSAEQQLELTTIAKDGVASAAQLNQYTSFIGNIMASRISALWDFSGPAITVSAEENSVFRCVELAESLFQTSNVEAVVIAAVDLACGIENITLRQHFGAMANNTNVDVLSQKGWVAGEGAGALVLKPVSQAKPESIYATIDGLALTNGLNTNAMADAVNTALQQAQINADQVSVVEAYASGFDVENQIEHEAMQQAYPHADLFSVKTNIGHTFAASGMASLIKSALLLDKNRYPVIAINGMGRDVSCAHVLLSASAKQHISAAAEKNKKPGLIKTIYLGGNSIEQSILVAADKPLISIIKQQLSGKSLQAVSRPVDLSNVMPHAISTVIPIKVEKTMPVKQTPSLKLVKGKQPISSVAQEITQQTKAHEAFLNARAVAQKQMSELISMQANIAAGLPVSAPVSSSSIITNAPRLAPVTVKQTFVPEPIKLVERFSKPKNIIYDTADLVEFAEGDIGKVFGPEYNIIDTYPRRVRLPTTDYLLVTRVTDLDAKVHEYKKSYMATEYDIPVDAPFLIDGQIPWSVSVESGQCDLMLISFIGIDFQAKGHRVYRLLDCQLTFLEEMAFGGETLRYEIYIDSYARNGDQLLFFFHYDCFVNGKKVLIMRGGCAGFFTDEELADGKGVIHTDKDKAEIANAKKSYFEPLIKNGRTQFEYADMMKLVHGDVAACFGPEYDQGGLNPSLKFSSEKFLMIERVTKIDAHGGHWGLGLLEGQKQLEPDHWYFPCHFKDDQVMAGSLMSEGCGQLAMFFMLWLGMHSNVKNARFQPLPCESQTVRCRGQVTPQSNVLTYRMEVTEMGMHPHPYMKANIDIILDGKVVVDFKNLSVMIKEQDAEAPYAAKLPDYLLGVSSSNVKTLDNRAAAFKPVTALNDEQPDETGKYPFRNPHAPLMRVETDTSRPKTKGVSPIKHFPAPMVPGQNRVPNTVPFTPWHMFEFATGNTSNCFGPAFDVYKDRIPPRTPCGDLQLVTQVVDVVGKPFEWKAPASCRAEYVVPEDAWYFAKNSHPNWMPYSILMEISLQPNGFVSGYMGTTLVYPGKDLFFRNLDGTGKLLKQIDLRGKTIVNDSVLVNTSMAGGSIIQSFTFELSVDGEVFYEGKAVFGYFSSESLSNQLGIDNGKKTNPWFVDNNTPKNQIEIINLNDSNLPLFQAPANKPFYRLAGGQMNFVDTVSIVEGGGKAGKGYILGEREIDATDWFFRYHFHQDPVMPGSLGVEAIIEIMQVYALKNNLGADFNNPRFIAPISTVVWKYRGQITPENRHMALDVHITDIVKENGKVTIVGDANLSKDGLRIYEVKDIVLSIIEA